MCAEGLFGFKEAGGSEKVRSRVFFLLKNVNLCVSFRCLVGSWEVKVKKYIVFFGVLLVM